MAARSRTAGGRLAARDTSAAARRLHLRPERSEHLSAVSFLVTSHGPDDEVDYRYLYELLSERAEREEDRSKAIDAKATALLAGVVAFIGFSSRLQSTPLSAGAALLYCIPLAFLVRTFLMKRATIVPSPESLVTFFPRYPVATLRQTILDMERSCRANVRLNETKTQRLDLATVLMAATTVCVLVVQFAVALR
jgi:hypothetical protein